MGIENKQNTTMPEQQIKNHSANIPAEQLVEQKKEISPEKVKLAEKTILDSLEIDSAENLDNFDAQLNGATKSLPRYQQIEKKLEGVEKQGLPYELFKLLKKDSDEEQVDPNAPRDGVLIKSIRQGNLECAGRTLVASTFLQEHGIDHVTVFAPGHAFLVIEQSSDTLVYFDANNNLFFTFPKSALAGYQDTKTSAECELKEYAPREIDFADGLNTVFSHFITLPAKEGVGRHYLGNIAAALDGSNEPEGTNMFDKSGIVVDKEAAEATHQIETKIYGENKVYENFSNKVEGLIKLEEIQTADDRKVISKILESHSQHNDFITFFIATLKGNLGDRFPYIKNAPEEQRIAFAEKAWYFLQKRKIDKTITGR